MKKLIPVILALLAFSCTKEQHQSQPGVPPIGETKVSESSNLKIDFSRLDTVYFVSSNDIEKYIHFKKLLNPKIQVKDITPFDVQGVTLFYVLNYENGWEMVSADKRTQPILGRSEKGSFTMKDYEQTPWGTWAYMLGLDVLTERIYGPETTFEENENLAFWGSLYSPSYAKQDSISFSVKPQLAAPLPIRPIEGENGEYVLGSVTYTTIDTVTINHMTTTRWKQRVYRNTLNEWGNPYVPYKSNDNTSHVPSGCVAVAGAQMAYFLHSKIGKPTHAPSEGYCLGDINNFSQWFSSFSTQIWDDMIVNNNFASDLLIGYVGQQCSMQYGNDGSSSVIRNLRPYFADWQVSSDIDFYDSDVVTNQLRSRSMPVIIGAQMRENVFDGHAFIIDSYRYTRQRVCYTYHWYWYPQYLGSLVMDVADRNVYGYTYLDTPFYRMNWGWGDTSGLENDYNAIDFAPNGTWEINDEGENRVYHFDWVRRMLYNF